MSDGERKRELTDGELDAILAAADRELLEFVRSRTNPLDLLAILRAAEDRTEGME